MKTIDISEVSSMKMVAGNEKRFTKVVLGDAVVEWVGFGWVEIRKATEKDLRTLWMVTSP